MEREGDQPDWQLEWDAETREILESAAFPVFAPEGVRPEVRGWGGAEGKPVEMVSLRHEFAEDRWIDVESEIDAEDVDIEDEAVHRLAGLPVEVTSGGRPVRVDGVHRRFGFASAGDRWVAIGTVGDVTITVQACGIAVDDLHLRGLADPLQLLAPGIPEYRPRRSARGVLDPRRVRDLARATPIEDLGATLAGFARSGFALLESEDTQGSWIGGQPHLPADALWPEGVHGAMTFVAQLALADLDRSVWTGPTSGHLHVFCDVDPESRSIEGAGACAILHTPAGADLTVRRFPSELHADNRIPQRMVTPHAGLTLPDEAAPLMRPLGLGFSGQRHADAEALWKLRKRLHAEQGWQRPAGQVLGWPTWQNDDNTEYLASLRGGQALEWTLLLQTDALDAELYVVLPTADLAAGRFDRAEATVEHD